MSLFPLDLDKFKDWSIQQLYYHLFPYIKDDFMGKKDCKSVHADGNMTVMVAGVSTPVTHILRGGSSIFAAIKEIQYQLLVQEGRITVSTAQETGNFTGRAR